MTPLYVIELSSGRLLPPRDWRATLCALRTYRARNGIIRRHNLATRPIVVKRVHRHFKPGDRVRHLYDRRLGYVVSGLHVTGSYTVKWDDGPVPFPYPSGLLLPAS